MPIPDGATRVTYQIMSSSVEEPFQVSMAVELGGADMELIDGAVKEAADLVLARFQEAYPGQRSVSTTRTYDCSLRGDAWPTPQQ
ncbi:hypothetical protein [[Kitasatospora] papulosa]|uniref:hypothetical protein n=1 Tax=[Kitasatospora] papulosa TaxID=1464011 RepID=UPI00367B44AC